MDLLDDRLQHFQGMEDKGERSQRHWSFVGFLAGWFIYLRILPIWISTLLIGTKCVGERVQWYFLLWIPGIWKNNHRPKQTLHIQFQFYDCAICPRQLKEDKGKFILTHFPLRFHRKTNVDTAKRPTFESLQEQPLPIHAENQLQDIYLGSFGLPSIEKVYGLHLSVEHDGMHGSVEPTKGLPHWSVSAVVDSIPSIN